MERRPDLQGMRALAVLAVFVDHLFGWPSGGFVGVDVFFVLSGFFITGLLIRERTTTGEVSFQAFYVRRAKRILPSAILVLIATVISAYFLLPAIRAKETLVDALYAAVFAANFRFQAVGADYFQQDQPPSAIQHYWSLSIEEQFYFVWPVLLAAVFSATRGLRRKGRTTARRTVLFGVMGAVVAASFAWALYVSASDPNAAYFSTFTRVWELGIGALLAIASPWIAHLSNAIRPALAYLGLTGVIGSLFLIEPSMPFPAPWAALPVLSTALVVASFQGAPIRGMYPLTNPLARWFGDTSYTLYLWHWPVIIMLAAVLPQGPLFYGVAIGLAIGLTAVTYYLYEDPIRKSDWMVDKPPSERRLRLYIPPLGWAFVGALTAAAVVLSILGFQYTDRKAAIAQADEDSMVGAAVPLMPIFGAVEASPTGTVLPRIAPLPGNAPCFGAPAMVNPQCALRNADVALTPSIDKFASDGGGPGCWNEKDTQPFKTCTFGYQGPDAIRIALVGDSHAQRLLKGLVPSLEENKWKLTTYIGRGCTWQLHPEDSCMEAMAGIQQDLIANPYALVITTSSRKYESRPGDYAALWAPVAAAGSKIAVVADTPGVSQDSLACLTRVSFGGDHTGECGTSRVEAMERPDRLVEAARLVPAAKVIDLTAYYCTDDRCPSVIGDVIVYSDAGAHLTVSYIKTLSPAIIDGVRQVLGNT